MTRIASSSAPHGSPSGTGSARVPHLGRWLGRLWAGPATLLGLLLAYLGRCHREQGLEFLAPARGPWAWFFAHGWAAITLGETIIYASESEYDRAELRAHERRHVVQWRRLGVGFPVAYALAGALALAMGRHGYRDNWLELDARRAAGGWDGCK